MSESLSLLQLCSRLDEAEVGMFSLARLEKQPLYLNEEIAQVQAEIEDVAFTNFRVFIESANCVQDMGSKVHSERNISCFVLDSNVLLAGMFTAAFVGRPRRVCFELVASTLRSLRILHEQIRRVEPAAQAQSFDDGCTHRRLHYRSSNLTR